MVVLSEHLLKRGHEVTAICPPGGWISRQLAEAKVPMLEWPMHGYRAPATVLRLRQYIQQNGVQIVHTHLTRAAYMGYVAGMLTGVPVVSTMHTLNRDWAYRFLPPRNHWFVAVSQDLMRAMTRRGVRPERVRVVYNGSSMRAPDGDPRAIAAEVRWELNVPPDAPLLGVFGRVDEFKGHHILVQAGGEIAAAFPDVHFLFVGHAAPAQQRRLRDLAARDGLEDRLRFTGVRDDVARLMTATDVVVLTSETEACSMAIIEAMMVGRPVVATRAGGNPELVADGETGLLVERTPADVARALRILLSNPERRAAMGEAGRKRALERFTAARMAEEMERLYEDILARRVSRTG